MSEWQSSFWYNSRTIEFAGGEIELTCKRCGYKTSIEPRLGDEWPSACPQCHFDNGRPVSLAKK
jgi:predicted Zn-ribbon and HTH transcriptional regulator